MAMEMLPLSHTFAWYWLWSVQRWTLRTAVEWPLTEDRRVGRLLIPSNVDWPFNERWSLKNMQMLMPIKRIRIKFTLSKLFNQRHLYHFNVLSISPGYLYAYLFLLTRCAKIAHQITHSSKLESRCLFSPYKDATAHNHPDWKGNYNFLNLPLNIHLFIYLYTRILETPPTADKGHESK